MRCSASLTLAKLPVPIVFMSLYLPTRALSHFDFFRWSRPDSRLSGLVGIRWVCLCVCWSYLWKVSSLLSFDGIFRVIVLFNIGPHLGGVIDMRVVAIDWMNSFDIEAESHRNVGPGDGRIGAWIIAWSMKHVNMNALITVSYKVAVIWLVHHLGPYTLKLFRVINVAVLWSCMSVLPTCNGMIFCFIRWSAGKY